MMVPYLLELQILRRQLARVHDLLVLLQDGRHAFVLVLIELWKLFWGLHTHAAVVLERGLHLTALLFVAGTDHLAA